MKNVFKLVFTSIALLYACCACAQDARSLVKEGIELSNARNYTGAIEKYKAALTLEPDNASAAYQLAFALQASGKSQEALPYLQKVVQSNASAAVISSAYGLMGGIYDQLGQVKKGIESYRLGLQKDSANYYLRYGLGLAYFRSHQYADAEQSAIAALRLDAQQPGSWRLYALVTFHQNKRANALLGFCTYLWLEPAGPQSAEAYGNLQHILQGGTLKPEPGAAAPHPGARTLALNQAITQAVAKSKSNNSSDQLSKQLQAIFTAIGQQAQRQPDDAFFAHLADWYAQLAQTPQVPAFAHYISQGADNTAAAWLKAHAQQVAALQEWMKDKPVLSK